LRVYEKVNEVDGNGRMTNGCRSLRGDECSGENGQVVLRCKRYSRDEVVCRESKRSRRKYKVWSSVKGRR
jgi:hypothetical protein